MADTGMSTLRKKLEKLSLEELQEMAEITAEIEERDSMEAAKSYVPNGKAEEFIKLVGSNTRFVNMFIGANGTSKTGTGANIVANIVFGPQSEWFKGLPLFEKFPYIKKGRIISDPTTLKEKIIPELIKWLPRNSYQKFPEKMYETTKEGKYYASKFIFNNGWVIDLMSNEQDLKSFESVDLGFLWIDEPMPKDKFMASLARGRLGMTCFWTYTPLFQAGWIKDWMDDHINDMADYVEAEAEDNCFAENTEVLTRDGWKDLNKMKVGDVVATYGLDTRKVEYQKVNSTVNRKYEGEMLDVGGGLIATPDHRMVVFNSDKGQGRTIKNVPLEIMSANKLRRGIRMLGFAEHSHTPTRFDSPFPNKISGDDWCEFIGWYIAEGCVTGVKGAKRKNNAIYITQRIKEKRAKLKALLERTGWDWKERKDEFFVFDKELHDYLFQFGNSYNKFLPRDIFDYSTENLQKLWETLLITDGDSKNRYLTSSKQLADDVQELLLKLGYRTSIREWKQGNKTIYGKVYKCVDLYCVTAMKGRYTYLNARPKSVYYNGIVSCVSVDNGTIIVRDKKEKYPLITGNCEVHGVRGFFKHEHIQRMADSFPEDEKEARVFGKFGHLLGRVHKKFNRKIHVIRPFPLNDKDWTTYKAIDPHPRVEDHVLYLSVNKKGTKIVSAELLSEGFVKQLHSRMIDLEIKHNFRIEGRIIDPSAYNDDQHRNEKSIGSQLFDLGESYIKGSKNMMAGIRRLEDAFDYEMVQGKMVREPEIFIFDTCVTTIKQLEQYVWDEHRGRTADERQKSGKPKDKNDHMPENLHRLILHEPKFVPYQFRKNGFVPKSSGMSAVAESDFDPY